MSSVVISGDTSGAITLSAPAVAGTNTITLPASTYTMFAPQIDQWYLTNGLTTSSVQVISSNMARVATTGFSYAGGGMSFSSGTFTFPTTGLYMMIANTNFSAASASPYAGLQIKTTTNNSSYATAAESFCGIYTGSGYGAVSINCFLNVTDTTLCKAQLWVYPSGSVAYSAGSATDTAISFVRVA